MTDEQQRQIDADVLAALEKLGGGEGWVDESDLLREVSLLHPRLDVYDSYTNMQREGVILTKIRGSFADRKFLRLASADKTND